MVEKVAVASQEIVQLDPLKVYEVNPLESILGLALHHAEQISLLDKIKNTLLAAQAKLINPEHNTCPRCGQPLSHSDVYKSSSSIAH